MLFCHIGIQFVMSVMPSELILYSNQTKFSSDFSFFSAWPEAMLIFFTGQVILHLLNISGLGCDVVFEFL